MYFYKIQKQYGTRFSLNIPKLYIEEHSKIAILGSNGSGKSTLLKILSGTIANAADKIEVQNFCYLPQQSYAFDRTVLKNVTMALWDVPKQSRKQQAELALEHTNLLHLKNERAKHLSGGETQRLALARVLARKPQILFLDEPTASCDIESEKAIELALQQFDGTLLFSTHEPAQALRLADKILFLDNGNVLEYEDAKDVLFHPKNPRVQEYMQHWKVSLDCCRS